MHVPRVTLVVTVPQRVLDLVKYLAKHRLGVRAGLHGQQLIGVAHFCLRVRVGFLNIFKRLL